MDALGTSLIVGGAAFLLSGLVFLLPTPKVLERPSLDGPSTEDRQLVEECLHELQFRRQR
jgi:hypothetical protein